MKKILKIAALLGLLTLVLLTTVSCKNIFGKLPFFSNDSHTQATTPETTIPEATTQPHAHTFGAWTTTQNATCTEKGKQERTCSCGEQETQEINALGHTEVVDAAVSPTCSTEGLSAGTHCSICGEILVAQEVIPVAHNWTQIALLESATCFTQGEERRACRTCELVENAPVAPLAHDFVKDEETQRYICSLCHGVVSAGHLYVAFEGEYHWFEAYQACKDMGGHLVTVTSAHEQAIITDIMTSELRTGQDYWMGGIRLTSSEFHWITGESFEYQNWQSKQPSGGEDFLSTQSHNLSSTNPGAWHDVMFSKWLGFVCEWDFEIAECEHIFTEWETTCGASCWNDGEQYRICTYCGEEETEVLKQLEHNFAFIEETGMTTCEHCNAAKYNGHIYVVFNKEISWFEAYSRCEALGGHLATITSEKEQTFITSYLKSLNNQWDVWLGGYSDGKQWHWVTDELFDYTTWAKGEPSNSSGKEWVVHVSNYIDWQWNDVPPLTQYAYLCEFECEE